MEETPVRGIEASNARPALVVDARLHAESLEREPNRRGCHAGAARRPCFLLALENGLSVGAEDASNLGAEL